MVIALLMVLLGKARVYADPQRFRLCFNVELLRNGPDGKSVFGEFHQRVAVRLGFGAELGERVVRGDLGAKVG